MSSHESKTIHTESPTTLFSYIQDDYLTKIVIQAKQTFMKFRQGGETFRTSQSQHHVRFTLCSLEIVDFFPVLSVTNSLLRVFERRQFGTGAKRLTMHCPIPDCVEFYLFCELVPFDKKYEGLRLGWRVEKEEGVAERSTTMHIGYVNHFRNGLQRAINWFSPATQIEYREIEDTPPSYRSSPKPEARPQPQPGFGNWGEFSDFARLRENLKK